MAKVGFAVAFAVVGALVGWAYLALLRHSLTHISVQEVRFRPFVGLMVVRIVLLGGGLMGALLVGPWCLVGYTVGFFVVRTVLVGKARTPKEPPLPTEDENV